MDEVETLREAVRFTLTAAFTVPLDPDFKNNPRAGFLVMFLLLALLSGWVANSLSTHRVKR